MQKLILAIGCVLFAISCNYKTADVKGNLSIEEQLKRSIDQYPDSFNLKANLIQFYRDSADYDKAINYGNNLLKKDSNNVKLWTIMATLLVEDQDTSDAIYALERSVQLSPDPENFLDLGTLYAETSNPSALAVANSLSSQQKDKTDKYVFFIRGLYFNYSGNKTKAISSLDSCLAVDYTYMQAYREKAIALYDLGKYNDAVSVLNKAITLQNNYDEGYYWRGRCLEKLGKIEEAAASYRSALLYSPDYLEAKEALDKLGIKN